MLIVVEDRSRHFAVPGDIAVCPVCFGNLYVQPDEIEKHGCDPDTYKVCGPILTCQSNGDHILDLPDDWLDMYDAVSDWFVGVTIKCTAFPS
jgi:hypothetical protein